MFTNPTYQQIKDLQMRNNSYDDALNKAKELHTVRDQLLAKRNSFSTTDLNKLQSILPENVDNIRFIININSIAAHHNLVLSNVDIGDISQSKDAPADAGAANPIGSMDIGFAVGTANYDDFIAFVQDLEHSLRLIDIEKISFSVPASGVITYAMTVRTYWLH